MPNGNPVGIAGAGGNVREVHGGQKAADDMLGDLTAGATPSTPPGYPGTGYDLPDGGWVGFRPVSKSGPPTIDVDIPGIPIRKIKFV